MKHFTNESEISSNGSKPSAWKKPIGFLGKLALALIFFALFLILILSMRTADNKTEQKLSQEFRKDLIAKGSMADSIFLPETEEIATGNTEITLTPEEKVTPNDGNASAVAPQENKEDKPEEKIVENVPDTTAPAVKKDTAKNTTATKPPVAPKKEASKAISCKHENDHPSYSKTKGKHMDEDCCPDPDERPKPGCVYSQKGIDLMLKGKSKGK